MPVSAAADGAAPAYHRRLNNDDYNDAVIEALGRVATVREARDASGAITARLQNGTFSGARPQPTPWQSEDMNVYDMKMDSSEERRWVRFYTKHGLAFPPAFDDCAEFFDTHPRIEIDRNTDSTPRKSKALLADYSNVNHNVHPVFSARAKQILQPRMHGLGRWIELLSDEAPYWLFWITNVVDALDEGRSEIARFTGSRKVMYIDSYGFKPEVVQDQFLFTLPQMPCCDRLVTDRFVDVVRQHRLTGFMFQRLWSSENGPEPSGVKDWLKPRITGLEPL